MNILKAIEEARIKAAEKVVCENLDKLGLSDPIGVGVSSTTTRRMTDKEKITELEIEIAELKSQLANSIPVEKFEAQINKYQSVFEDDIADQVMAIKIQYLRQLLPTQPEKDNG